MIAEPQLCRIIHTRLNVNPGSIHQRSPRSTLRIYFSDFGMYQNMMPSQSLLVSLDIYAINASATQEWQWHINDEVSQSARLPLGPNLIGFILN